MPLDPLGTPISGLNANDTLDGTETVALVQNTRTKRSLLSAIADYVVKVATSFLQSGTGATSRTAQAKMRDALSVKDFGATGDGITDDTAAIQLALNTANGASTPTAIHFPAGTYIISSTLQIYPVTRVFGDGRWSSVIKAASGFTGIMIQDTGNAVKIIVEDLQITANDEAGVTSLLDLGNLTTQWGTEGLISGLFLRGGTSAPAGSSIGLNLKTNVTAVNDVSIWHCASGVVETANSTVSHYKNIFIVGANTYGMYVHRAELDGIEIEAPTAACVGVYVEREAKIGKLTYSQTSGVTNPHAIEIDAGGVQFSMDHFVHYVNGGSVLTDILLDNRSGFKSNWGDSTGSGTRVETGLSDRLHVGTSNIFIQGQRLQAFKLRITNTAGTLQHRISGTANKGVAGDYQSKINAASVSLQNTPTGTDATTAMAFGGKISSASTSIFVLDTAAQDTTNTDGICLAFIAFNNTTTALICEAFFSDRNVNGVTQRRLEIGFYNAGTGGNFALTTANIGAGTFIDVQVLCFLR